MRGRITHDTNPDRGVRRDYWGVAVDSPDPPALARFYVTLLDWEIGSESDGWVTVRPPDGVVYLAFHVNDQYVRPVWPSTPGEQQQQLHLDFEVQDLEAAVAHAVELGAVPAEFQPQEDVRVMLDPDGHPFCLYLGSTE
jgi:catechol 2,3-dioxygenase-like lactoylglutathione lyase family enzyme